MGRRRRKGRSVNGILLLNKASGVTSNQALQQIKRLYDAAKAGHTGSLDPLAEGMLPICFGEATKLSGYLLDANKTYEVKICFGVKTDTGDADGQIVDRCAVPDCDADRLRELAEGFLGEQDQIPPMYSAVKHEGRRMYELAREGKEVERKPRRIVIHDFELLQFDGDSSTWRIHCSKGTYVRTLIEDLAVAAGSLAHVTQLNRLSVGPFSSDGMISQIELEAIAEDQAALDQKLLPMGAALAGWDRVELSSDSSFYFRQGQPIQVPRAPTDGLVAVFGPEERLLGVGQILPDGRVGPRRLLEFSGAGN